MNMIQQFANTVETAGDVLDDSAPAAGAAAGKAPPRSRVRAKRTRRT